MDMWVVMVGAVVNLMMDMGMELAMVKLLVL